MYTDSSDLIERGGLFHSLGAATEKAPSPFGLGRDGGTARSSWVEDLGADLGAEYGRRRSEMQGGAKPRSA